MNKNSLRSLIIFKCKSVMRSKYFENLGLTLGYSQEVSGMKIFYVTTQQYNEQRLEGGTL